MLNKHLISSIKESFEYSLTQSQEVVLEGFVDFLLSEGDNQILLIKGYAGTGKTAVISAIVRALTKMQLPLALMAPTGRAAKVFSGYAKTSVYTIHKLIYRQRSSKDGFGTFDINKNLNKDVIFFVDEASMISGSQTEYRGFGTGNLLEDLIQFVFDGHNCKLVLIGDSAQLPPVGCSSSPALDKDILDYYGTKVTEYFLKDIVRQNYNSGILQCATDLRLKIDSNEEIDNIPLLKIGKFTDVQRIVGEQLIDEISGSYEKYGIENTIIINRSNKRTNLYNKGIRGSILHIEEELTVGDFVLVVKNNYFWMKDNNDIDFIANGDIAEIVRIKGYEELYNKRFVNCTIRLIDYKEIEVDVKLLLDVLNSDSPGLSRDEHEKFFYEVLEDYTELKPRKKQYEAVKTNEYYNALQVKFAYAMTCHKSQGGQWKSVFIDAGFVPEENINRDYYRWLYTAITRCTDRLYLVNFKDEYFEE